MSENRFRGWWIILGTMFLLGAVGLAGSSFLELPAVRLGRWGRGKVLTCAYSPLLPRRAPLLAVATSTGIYIYDADTWAEVQYLETPDPAEAIVWSPDGFYLVSTHPWEGAVYIWDLERGQIMHTIHIQSRIAAYAPGGNEVALWDDVQKQVQIWDSETGMLLRSFDMPLLDWIGELAWRPDGQALAMGGEGIISILDIQDGAVLGTLDLRIQLPGSEFFMYNLAWHPGGWLLAISGYGLEDTSGIVLWEPGQVGVRLLRPPSVEDVHIETSHGLVRLDFIPFRHSPL